MKPRRAHYAIYLYISLPPFLFFYFVAGFNVVAICQVYVEYAKQRAPTFSWCFASSNSFGTEVKTSSVCAVNAIYLWSWLQASVLSCRSLVMILLGFLLPCLVSTLPMRPSVDAVRLVNCLKKHLVFLYQLICYLLLRLSIAK